MKTTKNRDDSLRYDLKINGFPMMNLAMTKILTHTRMMIIRGNVKHAVRLLASSLVRKNENRFNKIINR